MSADPLQVAAPSRAAADTLVARLDGCHCLVVQRGRDDWAVRIRPWREDARSLANALSAVEAWLSDSGTGATSVALGDRTFTMAAGARA